MSDHLAHKELIEQGFSQAGVQGDWLEDRLEVFQQPQEDPWREDKALSSLMEYCGRPDSLEQNRQRYINLFSQTPDSIVEICRSSAVSAEALFLYYPLIEHVVGEQSAKAVLQQCIDAWYTTDHVYNQKLALLYWYLTSRIHSSPLSLLDNLSEYYWPHVASAIAFEDIPTRFRAAGGLVAEHRNAVSTEAVWNCAYTTHSADACPAAEDRHSIYSLGLGVETRFAKDVRVNTTHVGCLKGGIPDESADSFLSLNTVFNPTTGTMPIVCGTIYGLDIRSHEYITLYRENICDLESMGTQPRRALGGQETRSIEGIQNWRDRIRRWMEENAV